MITQIKISDLFRLEKESKAIKDRIIRDIRNFFEHEKEENYYKPVMVGNFLSNNYIARKSKGDRKRLSVKNYLNKIKPYLKNIINNLKKSDMSKIQLKIAINFIPSKDNEQVKHSKSDNMEIMINDKAYEVIEELFKWLIKYIKLDWKNE